MCLVGSWSCSGLHVIHHEGYWLTVRPVWLGCRMYFVIRAQMEKNCLWQYSNNNSSNVIWRLTTKIAQMSSTARIIYLHSVRKMILAVHLLIIIIIIVATSIQLQVCLFYRRIENAFAWLVWHLVKYSSVKCKWWPNYSNRCKPTNWV